MSMVYSLFPAPLVQLYVVLVRWFEDLKCSCGACSLRKATSCDGVMDVKKAGEYAIVTCKELHGPIVMSPHGLNDEKHAETVVPTFFAGLISINYYF